MCLSPAENSEPNSCTARLVCHRLLFCILPCRSVCVIVRDDSDRGGWNVEVCHTWLLYRNVYTRGVLIQVWEKVACSVYCDRDTKNFVK